MRARYLTVFALFGWVSGVAVLGQEPLPSPPPTVGTIEIVGYEVFDETGETFFAPYRFANKVHVRTRDRVIRRELLFVSGDPVNAELFEQTERNLRGLRFLRDARVETTAVDADGDGRVERVDVRVVTWDAWSLAPRVDFEQVEDHTIWEAGFSEKNFLGLGKAITVTHRTNLDRTSDRVLYRDPQLAGSRFMLTASLAKFSDGDEEFMTLTRPYFSLRDKWTFSIKGGAFSRRDPLFRDGEEVGRLQHRAEWGDLELGRAIRQRSTSAVRFYGAYRTREEHVGSYIRDFGIVEVGISSVEHRFTRLTHINRFERTEDFNLGAQSHATVGLSTPTLGGGAGRVFFIAAGHSRGIAFRPDHLLLARVGVAARHEPRQWLNALAEARVDYLRKHATRHVLVGKIEFRRGHNLDPEVQILLGAESGLRGYPVRQFAGDSSLLLSAEERWFIADDVGQLVSLGTAAFVDSGFAWSERYSLSLRDLKTAVGVSLLVGSNRLSTRGGVRFDVGYALTPVGDTGRWVFAVGSEIGI